MEQNRSHEHTRIAFIPTERDWLVRLRDTARVPANVSLGPASLDRAVLAKAEIVLFDATAPDSLIEWLAMEDVVGIQLIEACDAVSPLAYLYFSSEIDAETLMGRAIAAYESRFKTKRVVGLLGAVGGCGLTEIAVTLAWQWANEGLPTLAVDASALPGDMSLRLGLAPSPAVAIASVQRVRPDMMFWLSTLTADSHQPANLDDLLPHINLRRVVVDLGTAVHSSLLSRFDDLVVVTRPTPGGIQRCLAIAKHFPELTVAVNGEATGPAAIAMDVLTRTLPGQIHRMPAVADVLQTAWQGVGIGDQRWQDAIGCLLPPLIPRKRAA